MKLADDIIESLRKHPEQWAVDYYCLSHRRTACTLWIGDGWLFCDIYDCTYVHLPMYQRWRVWRAVKRWRSARNAMILKDRLTEVENGGMCI